MATHLTRRGRSCPQHGSRFGIADQGRQRHFEDWLEANQRAGERVEVPDDQKTLHLHALRMTTPSPIGKGLPRGGARVDLRLASIPSVCSVCSRPWHARSGCCDSSPPRYRSSPRLMRRVKGSSCSYYESFMKILARVRPDILLSTSERLILDSERSRRVIDLLFLGISRRIAAYCEESDRPMESPFCLSLKPKFRVISIPELIITSPFEAIAGTPFLKLAL